MLIIQAKKWFLGGGTHRNVNEDKLDGTVELFHEFVCFIDLPIEAECVVYIPTRVQLC